MPTPLPQEADATPVSPARILVTKVFVRGLRVEAEIGIYDHERHRRQPLIVDIELDVAVDDWTHIASTVNYEQVANHARAIAAAGHIGLVERYAERLAEACFEEPRVTRARVRVEKPEALAPDAAGAGVEITAVRS